MKYIRKSKVSVLFYLIILFFCMLSLSCSCIAEGSVSDQVSQGTGLEQNIEHVLGTVKNIESRDIPTAGKSLVITWDGVRHAEAYQVYILNPNSKRIFLGITAASEIEVPSTILYAAGSYSIDVTAIAGGYSSSHATFTFGIDSHLDASKDLGIMGCLYLIISLFGFSSLFVTLMKKRFEEVLPASVALIILILYIFGILDMLLYGVYFVIILSFLSLAFTLYFAIRNKSISGFSGFFTPGTLVFLAMCLFIALINSKRMFSDWDEFSHWGLVVKNMYVFDKLGNHAAATTIFKGYPPAAALFEYFATKIYGSFNESLVYIAFGIFTISFLLPIFRFIRWKQWYLAIALSLIFTIVPFIFYHKYLTSIYIDSFLGICFAAILYTYFSESKLSVFRAICIGLFSFLLSISKASGSGLVIIALLIISADMLIKRFRIFSKEYTKLSKAVLLLLPWLGFLFGKLSWDIYLKATSTIYQGSTGISISSISQMFSGILHPYQYDVINSFKESMVKPYPIIRNLSMSYISWIFIFLLVGILLLYKGNNTESRSSTITWCVGLCFGYIIYSMSLLMLYLFTFSEYEAVRLASLNRYMNSYILGAFVFVLQKLLTRLFFSKFRNVSLFILIGLIALTPDFFTKYSAKNYQKEIKEVIEFRNYYSEVERITALAQNKNDCISIVSQGSTGLDYYVCNYLFTPVKSSPAGFWSLGKPYSEGDVWTVDLSYDKWINHLINCNVTYVYLVHVDQRFIDRYGLMFEGINYIDDQCLYKVVWMNNELKLISVTY